MPPKKKADVEEKKENPCARFGRVKNNLKMGLVGLPNVGKSSLFNVLCDMDIPAENYPFCTIDPTEARVGVPDKRFNWLCDVWESPSRIPAFLWVTDIAGLIRGAHKGDGLGNAFLSHIQAVDGIFHIVRCFDNPEVSHVDDTVDPIRDLETIMGELCQKDLAYVLAQKEKYAKDVKKNPKMKLPPVFFSVMERVLELLENSKPIAGAEWTAAEVEKINEVMPQCITTKPVIYLANLSHKDFVRKRNKYLAPVMEWINSHGGGALLPFSVEFEQAYLQAKQAGADALTAFNADPYNQVKGKPAASILPRVIKQGYKDLALMYYFTAGEKEVRCWTCRQGSSAPEAAGVIHSDFQRGFIKAEVCSFKDFKELSGGDKRGMAKVKAGGKYRQEGKAYVVKDGDIILFQFNVNGKKK